MTDRHSDTTDPDLDLEVLDRIDTAVRGADGTEEDRLDVASELKLEWLQHLRACRRHGCATCLQWGSPWFVRRRFRDRLRNSFRSRGRRARAESTAEPRSSRRDEPVERLLSQEVLDALCFTPGEIALLVRKQPGCWKAWTHYQNVGDYEEVRSILVRSGEKLTIESCRRRVERADAFLREVRSRRLRVRFAVALSVVAATAACASLFFVNLGGGDGRRTPATAELSVVTLDAARHGSARITRPVAWDGALELRARLRMRRSEFAGEGSGSDTFCFRLGGVRTGYRQNEYNDFPIMIEGGDHVGAVGRDVRDFDETIWHEVAMRVEGRRITFVLDGTVVSTTTLDEPLRSKDVELMSAHGRFEVDWFEIETAERSDRFEFDEPLGPGWTPSTTGGGRVDVGIASGPGSESGEASGDF